MRHDPPNVHVFHTGALGDSVLLWPMLRRLRRSSRVTLVTDQAKGQLAARELGIDAINIEQPRYTSLWRPGTPLAGSHDQAPEDPQPGLAAQPSADHHVARVISFLTDQATSVWAQNARRAYPNAEIELHPAPLTRPAALELAGNEAPCAVARDDHAGPVLLHVGAGSCEKRWPLDRWCELADAIRRLTPAHRSIVAIAGEAEAERFNSSERALFARLQGLFIADLETLAASLRSACLFVGNDSGPTHLAAQLGVPTVALFGPTDPILWAPIGPRVMVFAPQSPTSMSWLSAEHVAGTIRA